MRASLRTALLTAATVGAIAAGFGASQAANDLSADGDAAHSLIGSYLAANIAKTENDPQSAATYYRSALSLDPDNEVILEQAFQTEASEANWDRAVPLAKDLISKDANNRMAHLLLGLDSFKSGDFDKADDEFRKASDGPIGELTSALARAWTAVAAGKTDEALKLLEMPKQAEWAQFYLNYHKALIADVANRPQEAATAFQSSMRQDANTLRIQLAYARHAAKQGNTKLAKEILTAQQGSGGEAGAPAEPHVLVRELRSEIDAGKQPALLVSTPAEGMAEVFYGLGEALTSEGGLSMGILYLQFALFSQPDHAFALAALANAYETGRRYQDAINAYDRIAPGSALAPAIEIRKAFDLNSLDKVDEAKAILDKLVLADPKDLKPLDALGNILRARKRYAEAADVYTQALKLVPSPDKRHWSIFYSRGTCYERLKNWPGAEADLQKALELYPDQPLALNYLGYSWVDQNRNLKQGMTLIEKAVALKPDDGYIVDSLGWAHFKLGNYAESVRFLERAVELKPEDPVLNDHLGDALWRVGREREAKFQWDQALTLDPEQEEVEKIKKKLAEGLPPSALNRRTARDNIRDVRVKKRKESKLNPARVE
jgi:tetratricopeptide (TPR) repeat protein